MKGRRLSCQGHSRSSSAVSAIRRRRKCAMGATFPHATSVQNRLVDQRRNVRQRIGRIKRTRRFHIPSFLDQVFGSLPVACTRPESPPTTPPKRPWALCVGDKVECVWPGDSGYQFQITSVHRLAIGFPGGRKMALDPFTIKEMRPRWAQRLAQGIPGSQATTGFTTCARFSRTSSTHGWNIHNNTSVRWQLLGSAQ